MQMLNRWVTWGAWATLQDRVQVCCPIDDQVCWQRLHSRG
jgi:hypothetical protein